MIEGWVGSAQKDSTHGLSSISLVIAFAAETEADVSRARAKLLAKGADAIVLNDVSRPGIGFDSDLNAATFVTADAAIDIPKMPKREMADRILDQVVAIEQRYVALVRHFDRVHVRVTFAHRRHGGRRKDIGIRAADDQNRHAR